ncbi:hypothetical protein SAMN04487950_0049 [Halogranum rubrum]|uniref:Matrixin n=1 Tax=Halogranum rubrum TaxID=553466 RepID=A0A1I4ASI1_9EURY|nr:matrixin [Halogranum rubrum]SFK58841.1 hypothetical protein SAMN04487950_0049 [Halogranum rubrum]
MRNVRPAALTLALVCLVVVSGCLGASFDDFRPDSDNPAGSTTETVSSTGSTSPGPVSGTSENGTALTPVPDTQNPWGDDPIVVGIDAPSDDSRFARIVEEATAYWAANGEQYTGFDVRYRVDADAESPDLVVHFVDEVPKCGDTNDAVGCAPLVTKSRQIDRPAAVYVKDGLSVASTTLVTKHELGHTLGLRHDDAPHEVMRAESVLHTQPRLNATERDFPWRDAVFTVYVDDANTSDPDATREQVDHALDYYESGADGNARVPENISFEYVDSPEDADVVVRFSETSPCGEDAGSCFQTLGPDPDGDGAIETYTKLRITLVGLDTPAIGWHVGNWLAYGLGMEDPNERPEPFRDASYRDRRSAWWE